MNPSLIVFPPGDYDVPKKPPKDMINRPDHYNLHPAGIPCYEIVEHFSYHIATAMAYLWREKYKNGDEDIKKAIWHLNRELQLRDNLRSESTFITRTDV
jgi:hypothetical protein